MGHLMIGFLQFYLHAEEYYSNAENKDVAGKITGELLPLTRAIVHKHTEEEGRALKYHLAQPYRILYRELRFWMGCCIFFHTQGVDDSVMNTPPPHGKGFCTFGAPLPHGNGNFSCLSPGPPMEKEIQKQESAYLTYHWVSHAIMFL